MGIKERCVVLHHLSYWCHRLRWNYSSIPLIIWFVYPSISGPLCSLIPLGAGVSYCLPSQPLNPSQSNCFPGQHLSLFEATSYIPVISSQLFPIFLCYRQLLLAINLAHPDHQRKKKISDPQSSIRNVE